MSEEVVCSFYKKCKHFGSLCDTCKWNANNNLEDHLLIEDKDGKTLKFL